MTDTAIYIAIAIITLLASCCGELIKMFLGWIFGFSSKSNRTNEVQEVKIAVLQTKLDKIETNDLAHIKAQLDLNQTDHFAISTQLARLETKMDIVMNELKNK